MFLYRTRGEEEYLHRLNSIPSERLAQWRGQVAVDNAALCFTKPQLRAEFRYLDKNNSYWGSYVRHERRMRSRFGRIVPYQCMALFPVRDDYVKAGYAGITTGWSRIEVRRGCLVELPPVFTYKMEELMDPESGWWVVAYTEMIAKTASFILHDAYDNFK